MADTPKVKVSEIRAQFPMYADLSDDQLLSGIRKKYYADIPMAQFVNRIDYDTERARLDPTKDMSGTEKFLAGAGKAFTDTVRGAGQLVGLVDQGEVDQAKARDQALMNTGAGMAGNIVGNIAAAVPTVAIPGAATLRGAAAVGAGMGLLQPVASDESRLQNVAVGGGAGAGGVVAGRALGAAVQGGKALVEPFTQSGRDRIAGRMIQRFAEDPTRIQGLNNQPTITGARPTLAEQTGDAGLARLQDSLRSVDPQINNQIQGRLAENNAARVQALNSLAGTEAQREAAIAARQAATRDLYTQATQANYQVDGALADLLRRPAVQAAMARAKTVAENAGRPFTFEIGGAAPGEGVRKASQKQITGQGLQDLKMAMDEMLSDPTSGFAGQAGNAVRDLRGRLVQWMEGANPEFKTARETYAAMSRPINAQDVGAEISRRATSNTSDLAGNPRMQANALLGMLRDEQALLKRGTGRNELRDLTQVFDPSELNLLRAVAGETDRAAAVAGAGNGPGSATAQRMASQNILRQIVGPTGLPESWAEGTLLNSLMRPVQFAYNGVAEPRIQQALAEAVLDPRKAQEVVRLAQTLPPAQRSAVMQALAQGVRSTPAAVAVSGER